MRIEVLADADSGAQAVAWDLVQTFLAAEFSQDERHLRRLCKVSALEAGRHVSMPRDSR